jgi:hypothetical protein
MACVTTERLIRHLERAVFVLVRSEPSLVPPTMANMSTSGR